MPLIKLRLPVAKNILLILFLLFISICLFACDNKAKNNVSTTTENFFKLCTNGTPKQIEEAIKRYKIDINKINDEEGFTPLMAAAVENKNPEVIKYLLKVGANINAKTKIGGTALLFAAANNTKEIIKTLIDAGADINSTSNDGETPLLLAVQGMNTLESINYLIKSGIDINKKNNGGYNAILSAALSKRPDVVKALIDAGANVNASTKDGWTALMAASKNNEKDEIIKILISSGADKTLMDIHGKTAQDYLQENSALKNEISLTKNAP